MFNPSSQFTLLTEDRGLRKVVLPVCQASLGDCWDFSLTPAVLTQTSIVFLAAVWAQTIIVTVKTAGKTVF